MERAKDIVREVGIPFFLDALNMSDEETVTNSRLLDSFSVVHSREQSPDAIKMPLDAFECNQTPYECH